jgi:predicted Zn-dependent peptidase
VTLRPAFDPERIQLAKRDRMFRLRHRNDSPQEVLQRELNKLMYTAEHPRGRETRPQNIMAVDRDRLVAFHGRFYVPDRSYLAVVGDFSLDSIRARIRELFAGWNVNEEPLPGLPMPEAKPRPGIFVVDRDLNQSSIAVVHWGVDRNNEERFAISLMNTVLGGGSFSSRITERVRSDEGLAYSARSRYPTDVREVGLFEASVQTKTESTVRAIQLILSEVEKMQSGTISQNEFGTAKESRLYSYVFGFDDPVENVIRLMELEFEALPADYYEQEFRGYQEVTLPSMVAAGRDYLRPQDLTIFVVGKLDEFREELSGLGEIQVIEVEEFDMPPGGGKRPGGRGRPEGGARPSPPGMPSE